MLFSEFGMETYTLNAVIRSVSSTKMIDELNAMGDLPIMGIIDNSRERAEDPKRIIAMKRVDFKFFKL